MLAHRLQRWLNIKPALWQCLVFTGLLAHTATRIYWPVIPSVTSHGPAGGKQNWLAKRQVMEFTGIFSM